jgi:hypothetical protein
MADIRHALWFIAIAGSIFVISIAFEWGYLFHRGNRSAYDLREVDATSPRHPWAWLAFMRSGYQPVNLNAATSATIVVMIAMRGGNCGR